MDILWKDVIWAGAYLLTVGVAWGGVGTQLKNIKDEQARASARFRELDGTLEEKQTKEFCEEIRSLEDRNELIFRQTLFDRLDRIEALLDGRPHQVGKKLTTAI